MAESYHTRGAASSPSTPIDPVADLLGGDRTIAFRASLAHLGGGALAGLLLSQFWYYSNLPTSQARGGWFYMTMADIEEQTGMTRTEQETARRRLRTLGVLEEDKRGIPMKIWFRVDKERLYLQLREYAERRAQAGAGPSQAGAAQSRGDAADNLAENLQDDARETRRIGCGKPAGKRGGNPQAILKTSSENSSPCP